MQPTMTAKQPQPLLTLNNVDKSFPGVLALQKVNLEVYPGQVHVLLGENGAGKSTLIKILTGAYLRDGGEFLWEGQPVSITGPQDSMRLGISAVYQELSLVPHLSVAENIFLGREPRLGAGLIDWASIRRATAELMETVGHALDPDTKVAPLSMGIRQLVEIAKALSRNARLLILDEPTSSLSQHEVATLMDVVRRLKAKGLAIVYITHKLDEVLDLGDTVTILRDGRWIATRSVSETTEDEMVSLMVGRDLAERFPKVPALIGAPALTVRGLTRRPAFENVSFTVHQGEVLGLFGLVGAGRTEVARVVFGADPLDNGEVEVAGRPTRIRIPADAVQAGIALLSEDRKNEGLVMVQDLIFNATFTNLEQFRRRGLISAAQQAQRGKALLKSLKVRPEDPYRRARDLSGGNQQKVVLAKWLNTSARVFIFDEPTRGIDVGAKVEIYQLMNDLVAQGKAVLMISSELPELLGMSDRILVMRAGRLAAEFSRGEATQEKIMKAATGGVTHEP